MPLPAPERDGAQRAIGGQNDLGVIGASDVKDVVNPLLAVWREASENSDEARRAPSCVRGIVSSPSRRFIARPPWLPAGGR